MRQWNHQTIYIISWDLPRFFWPPFTLPLKLLLFVMELLFSVFCCFSCSVADGDFRNSFCCSIEVRLFKLDVDPLCEPPLEFFEVFSMLSIKLLTESRESCRVMKGICGTTVPFDPFLTTPPLFFCFRRWAISCWTVVRMDCWDSLDEATTVTEEKKFFITRNRKHWRWFQRTKLSQKRSTNEHENELSPAT